MEISSRVVIVGLCIFGGSVAIIAIRTSVGRGKGSCQDGGGSDDGLVFDELLHHCGTEKRR